MKFNKELYNLELEFDSDTKTYEVNLWLSEGSKICIAKWGIYTSGASLEFINGLPFSDAVNKDIFWQIISEGQEILNSYFNYQSDIESDSEDA